MKLASPRAPLFFALIALVALAVAAPLSASEVAPTPAQADLLELLEPEAMSNIFCEEGEQEDVFTLTGLYSQAACEQACTNRCHSLDAKVGFSLDFGRGVCGCVCCS